MTIGTQVRTLTELVSDGMAVIPAETRGVVIGYEGERLVVEVHDMDSDIRRTVLVYRWEVRATR